MKLFLEEKTLEKIDGVDVTSFRKIKEITDIKEAVKGQFIHKCRHDENPPRACERVGV